MLGTDTTPKPHTPSTGAVRLVDAHVACQAYAHMLVVDCPNRAQHRATRSGRQVLVCAGHLLPSPR